MPKQFIRLALAAGISVAALSSALAQSEPIRIGVMNDQNGPFSDLNGAGSVIAAELAIEDAGGTVLDREIEVLVADHQNKPDIASAIATRWFDEQGVHAIFDLPVTAPALAVQFIAKERGKISVVSSAGAAALVGQECSPTGFLWTYSTFGQAMATASGLSAEGNKSWYFITSDYTFGYELERTASEVVDANGGTVLGAARHPINSTDFSSYALQAQASGAEIVGLANGGADTVNAIKQASEFGLVAGGQSIAAMMLFLPDIHSIGLPDAQGLRFSSAFYWDRTDETRAFTERFAERSNGRVPSQLQAGVYSAVLHYLKAMEEAGTDEGTAVAAKMKEMPVNDMMTDNARIRPDGYVERDFYLFEVKAPTESQGEWDYLKQIGTIAGADAAPPVEGSGCALISQ